MRLELTVPVSATGILSYTASISADGLALAQASGHVLVQDEADVSAASGQDAVVPQAPDAYYGSLRVALVPSASGGSSGTGPIWTSIPEIPGITFGNLPLASVSAGLLSAYDTVALMQVCNVATALTPGQKADLIDWLGNGGKLIIYDSDACSGSNTPSYLWLIYPFTTNNPGRPRRPWGGAGCYGGKQPLQRRPCKPVLHQHWQHRLWNGCGRGCKRHGDTRPALVC